MADTAPSPVGAVRAMQSLAAAADTAHRAGVALSIDHPSRVRVSIEGDVVLAYPATMPDANPEDDIRGIGASLYALLVNRWPLPEFGVRSGLAPADRDGAGLPVEPNSIDRDIPFQISAVAVRAVQEDGGIRSASTLLNLLQQATAVADRTEVLGPIDDSPPPPTPRATGAGARDVGAPTPQPDDRRRRGSRGHRGRAAGAGLDREQDLRQRRRRPQQGRARAQRPRFVELVVGVGESRAGGQHRQTHQGHGLLPRRDPDNAGQAGQAIDGDPSTSWATEVYTDAVPFPSFKQGEGLILQLPKPTVVGQVTIDMPSTGTKVEIRSASTPSPSKLDDTTVLAPAFRSNPAITSSRSRPARRRRTCWCGSPRWGPPTARARPASRRSPFKPHPELTTTPTSEVPHAPPIGYCPAVGSGAHPGRTQ